MKKLYSFQKANGELAVRQLSEKAYEVYSETDPFEVYKVDDDSFSIRGAFGDLDNLTFKELEEMLESYYDEYFTVEEDDEDEE